MSDRHLEEAGFKRHGSTNYDEYLKHQAQSSALETNLGMLAYYEERYQLELGFRLQSSGVLRPGMSVLCLAARLGAEVKAFISCGCFAVGLDLNPGEGNKYVLHGDFHQIQFANDSVDVIFTNAVDHVFNLGIFISEVVRVLKPDGLLIMELLKGRTDGVVPMEYETLSWEMADDILTPFLAGQMEPFDLILKTDLQWPWPAQHLILRRRERIE